MMDGRASSSSSSSPTTAVLNSNPSSLTWIRTLELGYELPVPPSSLLLAAATTTTTPATATNNNDSTPLLGSRCFYCGSRTPKSSSSPSSSSSNSNSNSDNNDTNKSLATTTTETTTENHPKSGDSSNDDSDQNNDINNNTNSATTTTPPSTLLRCAQCLVATYCSRDCQVHDWKQQGKHKLCCESLKRLGPHLDFCPAVVVIHGDNDDAAADSGRPEQQEQNQEHARRHVFQRIRFYACAYAVHQACTLGPGFLFLQSPQTLAALSLPVPCPALLHGLASTTTTTNSALPSGRSVLLHYLTLGEFDAEVCRDDFEMATIRSELQQAVRSVSNTNNPPTDEDNNNNNNNNNDDDNNTCSEQLQQKQSQQQQYVVVLMRFRCGHVALGKAVLVPDWKVCRQLGMDYFGNSAPPSLQLNIDDD